MCSDLPDNICSVNFTLCLLCSALTSDLPANATSRLRSFSWFLSSGAATPRASRLPAAEGGEVFQQLPWQYQQVRTRKRGTEYQPKNIKRKRTHGWIKRLSSKGGIEVILRRMLKGRKSLSHWRLWNLRCSECSRDRLLREKLQEITAVLRRVVLPTSWVEIVNASSLGSERRADIKHLIVSPTCHEVLFRILRFIVWSEDKMSK